MNQSDIYQKLTAIFQEVFDDPGLQISDRTTAKDVEQWDSLSHINLIVATEKAFGLTFTTKEVKGLANVGDFVELIARRPN
jgi:acyl carrier protein